MLLSSNSRLPSQESHGEFGEMPRELRNPTTTIELLHWNMVIPKSSCFFLLKKAPAMEKF